MSADLTERTTRDTSKTYATNLRRDLWLLDAKQGFNVYFIPHEWADLFNDPEGDEATEGPTAYCYAPTSTSPNSPVDLLWMPLAFLDTLTEIDEGTARRAHPALDEYLRAIEEGKDP